MSLVIPRKDEDKEMPGMGNAYIEFYTLDEAKEVRRVNIIILIFFSNLLEDILKEDVIRLYISQRTSIEEKIMKFRKFKELK